MFKIASGRAVRAAGFCALVLAGAAAPQSAAAQSATDRADARCILVLTVAGRDPKQRAAAAEGVYYYMGRIDARGSGAGLEALLGAEGKSIRSKEELKADLTRCGATLRQRSLALQTAFENLRKLNPPAKAAPASIKR